MTNQFEEPVILKTIKEFPSVDSACVGLSSRSGIVTNTVVTSSGETLYEFDCSRIHTASRLNMEAKMLLVNSKAQLVSRGFPRIPAHKDVFHLTNREINWNNALAEQKVFGVPVTITIYNGQLLTNVRKNSAGDPIVNPHQIEAFISRKLRCDNLIDKFASPKYCWIFEYISPSVGPISEHVEEDLILLGIYNKENHGELKADLVENFAETVGFSRPWCKRVYNEEAVHDIMSKLTPLDEGIVVKDNLNCRMIFRNDAFRVACKILESPVGINSMYHMVDIFKSNYDSVQFMCRYYDKFSELAAPMDEKFRSILFEIEREWNAVSDIEDKREFTNSIASSKHRTILSGIRSSEIKDFYGILKHISWIDLT